MISHGIYQFCPPNCTKFVFFWSSKKLSSDLESPRFSAKRCECKIEKRDGHGKVFCQVCGNPALSSNNPSDLNFGNVLLFSSLSKMASRWFHGPFQFVSTSC